MVWETRVSEKEKEVSDLSIQVQNLKITLNIFLGEYNLRVGLLYVELDKLKVRIKEYQLRVNLARGKRISPENLKTIEKEVSETFSQERFKIDELENEAFKSSEEYKKHSEEEKKWSFDGKFQEELKTLYRKLALKFHPDRAKDEKQRKQFNKIMAQINEAYRNGDLKTLRKYMKQAEREEKIAKETPEEKLSRLKEEYKTLLSIIAELEGESEDLKASETYKLKERVDLAKKEGRDLLQDLSDDIKVEIAENQTKLDELVEEYKRMIGDLVY